MTDSTVLCVDDEANVLSSLSRLLRKENYTLLTAQGGEAGLKLLETQPAQLVVSDHRMPNMTGVEFLQKVKERFPESVRVILSGYADTGMILEAINKGEVYRFLSKPWNDEDMKVALRQCLEHYHLTRKSRELMEQVRLHNEELERMVEERTVSLRLSQEILAQLPLPVIGIDPEGTVALVNEAARACFQGNGLLGLSAKQLFPTSVWADLEKCLKGDVPACLHAEVGSTAFRITLRPLKQKAEVTGWVCLLEKPHG